MAMNKSQGLYVTRQSRKNNSATFLLTSHLYCTYQIYLRPVRKILGPDTKNLSGFLVKKKRILYGKEVDLFPKSIRPDILHNLQPLSTALDINMLDEQFNKIYCIERHGVLIDGKNITNN